MERAFSRNEISFTSSGETCRGLLYLPKRIEEEKYPCVVLANGFSGTMDWILPSFGEAFSSNGFAALTFDYRFLGESEGTPRQLIDPVEQSIDLKNAVAFARQHDRLDSGKIVLWGTSLGGSHVFRLAADDSRIAAVIATMPALDAIKGANIDAKMKQVGAGKFLLIKSTLQLVAAGLFDLLKGIFGFSPFYLKVYGKPGRAFFADPALSHLFERVERESPTWKNRIAARFLFKAPRYVEGTFERIKVPILISLALNDVEVSGEFIKEKCKGAAAVEITEYTCGHFDLYHGEPLRQVLADQVDFLKKMIQQS